MPAMYTTITGSEIVANLIEAIVEKRVAGKASKASAVGELIDGLRQRGQRDVSEALGWLEDILDLNTELRQGWRQYSDGISEGVCLAFPCQELFMLCKLAREPYDWQKRWLDCGGAVSGARMIAPKDAPVWIRISDFGFPFPPYALHSGMWVKDVLRSHAAQLGVIELHQSVSVPAVLRPQLIMFEPHSAPKRSNQAMQRTAPRNR